MISSCWWTKRHLPHLWRRFFQPCKWTSTYLDWRHSNVEDVLISSNFTLGKFKSNVRESDLCVPEGLIKYEFKIFEGSTPFTSRGLRAKPRYHRLHPSEVFFSSFFGIPDPQHVMSSWWSLASREGAIPNLEQVSLVGHIKSKKQLFVPKKDERHEVKMRETWSFWRVDRRPWNIIFFQTHFLHFLKFHVVVFINTVHFFLFELKNHFN